MLLLSSLNAPHKKILLWLLTLLLFILPAGCIPGTADARTEAMLVDAEMAVETTAVAATAVPAPTLLAQPVVVYNTETAAQSDAPSGAGMPSFAPAAPAELTAQATLAPPTPTPDNAADATPSPTPQPTFTPPALPLTSPDDHYWFRRPVAEGGVVWTDKVYPYGGTRGGQLRVHHGVEFNVPYNTEILAVASGTVVFAGSDDIEIFGPEPNFYGRLVIIEHDSRWRNQPVYTLYGHLNETVVAAGQRVDSQQVIGISGATGVADGPHMHFEVRVGFNTYEHTRNPLLWLYPFPDRGAVAGRVTWPNGELAAAVPITLRRVDAPSRYAATTTYEGDSVNADDVLKENFVFDDVDAGFYEIEIKVGETKYTEEFWVFPYRTSFVELVLGGR